LVSNKGGNSPQSTSNNSSVGNDDLPQRKFKNFRTLLSMKVAANEHKNSQ